MQSHSNVKKVPALSPVGEAQSHLKEVVLEIAFPLRALFEPLKYLLSLLGTYIKAGKFLLGAHYSFTLGHPSPTCQPQGVDFICRSQQLFRPTEQRVPERRTWKSPYVSRLICSMLTLSGLTLVEALTCLGSCVKGTGFPYGEKQGSSE